MRILTAIPSVIVHALLVYAGAIVWVVAAVLVLVVDHSPAAPSS